ncbi:TIGR01777 family protein [Mycobacterium sp. PS03-16]|uniref:TIGR01777 family oxidoreductase n=1 Tax=Mycobacterium sp. PS03-16 TaxID=2559611 RepID=UPI001073D3C6|nr:TIGR01777 family oxidoreductase [Mycobacterium sp. PS03-16]TFV60561.1 TIGR01777 family protein [Mycobacterium sp. PS03-16]
MADAAGGPATSGGAVIAIAGSSGLIGSALVSALRAADRRVVRIVRRAPSNADELFWNPDTGEFDAGALRGVDAVINLCGVNVGQRRWSGAFKQSLRDSRIAPTEVLAHAVAEAGVPVLVNASAVGYYGDTRSRVTDESAPAGQGFLARLCVDWEAATGPAAAAGARVVLLRTGLVLSPAGGLLARLRPLFSLGLGARLGNGRQYMPWISLEDQVRAVLFTIGRDELSGPVNVTGPAPVTNAEFTAALGRAVNRPTALMVPGFALRTVLGEFADEGLLGGQRAIPAALERAGFAFHHNTVGEALAYATGPRDA